MHAQLERDLQDDRHRASAVRMRWLLRFVVSCGLRAEELLQARRNSMRAWGGGRGVHVHCKGSRNRWVAVPTLALDETWKYFASRGIDFDLADGEVSLLAALDDPSVSPTYSALH